MRWLTKGLPHAVPNAYAGGQQHRLSKDTLPLFSPLFDTSTAKLPPALVSLATVDRLYAEQLAYYVPRLKNGEATVQVDIYEDQFHVGFGFDWAL